MPKINEAYPLVLNKELLGFRFKTNEGMVFDIEIAKIGVIIDRNKLVFSENQQLTLKSHGDVFLTEYEIENNIVVDDYSKSKYAVRKAIDFLTERMI